MPSITNRNFSMLEQLRQSTLADYQLDRAGAEPEFDAIAGLAAELFAVPISAITVLGPSSSCFTACVGKWPAAPPAATRFAT